MDDENEELAQLRKRKLLEMQAQQDQMAAVQEQRDVVEAQKQTVLRSILTPEARERLGRVKVAHPDLAAEVERQLVLLASSGRLATKIDDETMKQVLAKMMPKTREINIRVKRK